MNNILKLIKKVSFFFINIYVSWLLLFKRKDKKCVVIGAWDGLRYADNSRYLFEYLSKNTEFTVIWITKKKEIYRMLRSQGKNVVMMGTKECFNAHITAYYHIVCTAYADISGEFSWGAIKINLGHGMPIKLVDKLANKGGYKQRTWIQDISLYKIIKKISICNPGGWNNCYYVSPGKPADKQLMYDFQVDDKWIIKTNYPRNIMNENKLPEEEQLLNLMKQYKYSIIYLPTFRENNNESLLDPIKNQKINELLIEYNILWIDKKHFVSSPNLESEHQENIKNIIHLDSAFDIYTIIDAIDLIITDYSSVYFDALYHLKKIILYMPDYEYYKNNDRGFLLDPTLLDGCIKVYGLDELVKKLFNYFNSFSIKEIIDEKYKKMYWSFSEEGMKQIWSKIIKVTDLKVEDF